MQGKIQYDKKMFKFYTDKAEEFDNLFNMIIDKHDSSNTINRAAQYGIPANIISDKTGKKLQAFLYSQYKLFARELKQSVRFHKSFMSKNGAQIRNILEKIFEHDIPTYNVRLDSQITGMSDWYTNKICINAFSYLQRFKARHMLLSLIWETALSLTFIDIRKKYSQKQISDKKVWAISELTAMAIWKSEFSEYDWHGVNVGYSELLPYQDKISKLYQSRKNFAEFLDSAVKLFKTIKIK